jgi:hypothetical protein
LEITKIDQLVVEVIKLVPSLKNAVDKQKFANKIVTLELIFPDLEFINSESLSLKILKEFNMKGIEIQ